MKKVGLTIITLLIAQSLSATVFEMNPSEVFKEPQVYGQNSELGFELVNKSPKTIWIALKNGEDLWTQPITGRTVFPVEGMTGDKRTTIRLQTDINAPTSLAVWFTDPGQVNIQKKYGIFGAKEFSVKPDRIYTFTQGKTDYLTWDKDNFPRPETGPLFGLFSKTDSNLSLQSNVKKEDIKEVKTIT